MNSRTAQAYHSSIDICRYLCAILVVAIHTEPFMEISPYLAFGVKHILGRIAVPFFFAVSGHFHIGKLENKTHPFLPYVKRLLSVYVTWFLIYLGIDFIQHGLDAPISFLFNAAKGFFFNVSPSHFWFFPALIYCVCFITLLNRLHWDHLIFPLELLLCIFGVLGSSLLELGQQIPFINRLYLHSNYALLRKYFLMAPSYFLLGVISGKLKKHLAAFSTPKAFLCWLLSGILWGTEIIYVKYIADCNLYTGMSIGLYLFAFFTLLLLIQHPLPQLRSLSVCCKTLANFTYYSHILFINLINQFTWKILGIDLTNTQMFFVCTLLTCMIGLLIHKTNLKCLNKLVR